MPCRLLFLLFLSSIFLRNSRSDLSKLRIREGSKIFMRVTLKLNTVPYTKIFANAIGYRINWDILPAKKKKKKKISRKEFVLPYAYPYPYPHQKFLRKRDVHDTLSNILDRHGFNGSSCVLRAGCESSLIQPFDVKTQLFAVLFPPIQGEESEVCEQTFDDCPLSLLHILTHND